MRSAAKDRPAALHLAYAIGFIARWLASRWLELCLVGVVFLLYEFAATMPAAMTVTLWIAIAVGTLLDRRHGSPVSRGLWRLLGHARLRRQLARAAEDSGVAGLSVARVEATLPGELVDVYVPRGLTIERLDKASSALAGCLRVSDVRVLRDHEDRSHAKLSIIRRDVFASMQGTPWPLIDADEVDADRAIPLGTDEYGRVVHARLLGRNILIGGAPDAGKSTALRIPIAACALDPRYRLWLMDAKAGGAEFVHWAPAAHRLVRGRQLEEAVELFAELEQRVEARYRDIVAEGEVFVLPDMERDVLVIDELPQFMRIFETDSKDDQARVKTIRGAIWKLIATGRAAGMITILSALKPTADVVPTESRDLVDHRLALHCNTRQMSDAVLGDGAGESPANAAEIPSGQPGVAYYLGDGGVQKIRLFFISHRQALGIAERVGARALDRELEALS